jgi:hypothetical protein
MAHASLPKLPGLRLIASMPRNRRRSESPSGRTIAPRRSEDQMRPLMMSAVPALADATRARRAGPRIPFQSNLAGGSEKMHFCRPADNSENTGRVASLLDQTLAAALQDKQTVTSESKSISPLIEGVRIRDIPTHLDERAKRGRDLRPPLAVASGPVCVSPLLYGSAWISKRLGLHKTREDRYFMLLQEPIARTDCKN